MPADPAEYGCSVEELKALVASHDRGVATAQIYTKYGDVLELCRRLKTSVDIGLSDPIDIHSRKQFFGSNIIPPKKQTSLFRLMFETIQDPTLVVLIVAALLSLGLSFYNPPDRDGDDSEDKSAWVEATAILGAVLLVVLVTAFNDYAKDGQFRKLQAKITDEHRILVLRSGEQVEISHFELVVGDIYIVKRGDILYADCILVETNGLQTDESSITGESAIVHKNVGSDPVLLSGTHVMEGGGKAVVVAVGLNSQKGNMLRMLGATDASPVPETASPPKAQEEPAAGPLKTQHELTSDDIEDVERKRRHQTVYRQKLTKLALYIGYLGTATALLTVTILLVRFCIDTFLVQRQAWHQEYIEEFVRFIIVGLTVLVVAVPEGLPLAVTLSLAYSSMRMTKDNNLVRHLDACETMGGATTICTDKTGTLTTNKMTVVEAFVGDVHYEETPIRDRLPINVLGLLVENICVNSGYDVNIATRHSSVSDVGNKTECALLRFVQHLEEDFHAERHKHPENTFIKVFGFNSTRKFMATVVPLDGGTTGFRVLVKGAPELILNRCTYIHGRNGEIETLSRKNTRQIQTTVVDRMSASGLRTLCLAYKNYMSAPTAISDRSRVSIETVKQSSEDDLMQDLTAIAILGLEDPLRPEVPDAIRKCKKAGIVVRMITGDSVGTAVSIALKSGIIAADDGSLILDGNEFNARIRNSEGNIDQSLFDAVWPSLRVLARSSPSDKYNLTRGIIRSHLSPNGEVVAVTGDGTNDAPALRIADVGFAMGLTGTDVAKEASDIIIADDSFTSIVKAVMWGRNVYDSIGKFLQFQLTVNIVTVLLAFIGACAIQDTPIKAVQMLWLNLIMDTLASLALATELPNETLLKRKPYGRTKGLINGAMLRNILGHVAYQLTIVFLFLAYGAYFFAIDDARRGYGDDTRLSASKPTQHFTLVFNVFVLMTLFNEINCRTLDNERDVFSGILSNKLFIVIWLSTFVVQILIVQLGGLVFVTAALTLDQWMWCCVFGIGSLLWEQIMLSIPTMSSCSTNQNKDTKFRIKYRYDRTAPASFNAVAIEQQPLLFPPAEYNR